jgi:hypothetical protein
MSATTTIEYGDRWFWSYDLARSVLLAEVIMTVRGTAGAELDPWTDEVLDELTACAEVSDFALSIDPAWGQQRLGTFTGWLEQANRSLGTRAAVEPKEAAHWPLEDFEWRGTDAVPTASVISLGTAVIQLIRGTLPAEPPGKVWCYGFAPEPTLLPHGTT